MATCIVAYNDPYILEVYEMYDMTPTEQDCIIGYGYGLAIEILMAGVLSDYKRVFRLIDRDCRNRKIGIRTQLLSVVASCRGTAEEKHAYALDILHNRKIQELKKQFRHWLFEDPFYLEIDENMLLCRDVRSKVREAIQEDGTVDKRILYNLQIALRSFVDDATAYERMML